MYAENQDHGTSGSRKGLAIYLHGSHLEFDLVYKFKKIMGRTDF